MDPITLSIIGMGGQVLLSALGEAFAAGDDAKAQAIRKQIADKFGSAALPQFEHVAAQQVSQLAPADDSLRRSQMDALGSLEREYRMGGMTDADKAAMELAANRTAAQVSGDAATVQQNLAARGMGGGLGGAYLTMAASQAGANALGQQALASQVEARRRALAALESGASLAGNINQQDLARAQAQSGIDQFNARMRFDAQQANNNNAQATWNAQNTSLNNWADAQNNVAGGYQNQANSTRRVFGSAGQAVGQAGQIGAGYLADTKRKKAGE